MKRPFTNGKGTKSWEEQEGMRGQVTKEGEKRSQVYYVYALSPHVIITYCKHILIKEINNYQKENQ